jgi:Tol biopolymer transport system component
VSEIDPITEPVRVASRDRKLLLAAVLLLIAILGAALAIGGWNTRPTLVLTVPVPSATAAPVATPASSVVLAAEPTGDLLFVRGPLTDGPGNGTAWRVPVAGGPPVELGPATEATWAADGRSIHLVSQDNACVPTLTTISDTGAAQTVVNTGLHPLDGGFAWSPDGREIVFARFHNGPPGGSCRSQGGVYPEDAAIQDIIAMNADGTGQRVLVAQVFPSRPVRWSSDGTRIAYTNNVPASEAGPFDPTIVQVSDGLSIPSTTVVLDGVNDPGWSPDDTRLAFTYFVAGAKHFGIATVEGASLLDLGPGDEYALAPAWSPNGKALAAAFQVAAPDGTLIPGGIVIQQADGSGRRVLNRADAEGFDGPPSWSPDGAWLAYVGVARDGPGSGGIQLAAADGMSGRVLDDTAGAVWVAWQPNP